MKELFGSYAALVTPMNFDGSVDYDALGRLIEFQIENGTHGLVSMGTTGESATLNVEEHLSVVEYTVKAAAGRVTVIAGTGANSTREAVHLTSLAKDAGVDACLLVVPYYNKPSQEGLYQHFKQVAEAVDIPQILYNVPSRTVASMDNSTVERLAGLDNIVAIKDATGNMEQGADLINRVGDKITVLSGDDESVFELIKLGAKGNISVLANIAPQKMSDLCVAAVNGDYDKAAKINAELSVVTPLLFCEANPIPVKWALQQMNFIQGRLRLPLTELGSQYHADLSSAMKDLGLI